MVKNKVNGFKKMSKDILKEKTPDGIYFDAHNIRFVTNKEVVTGGFSFEKGNDLVITIPNVSVNRFLRPGSYSRYIYSITYDNKELVFINKEINNSYLGHSLGNKTVTSGKQIIIGNSVIRNNIILFTTDDNGFDCIWKVNDSTFELELLYLRNLGFSSSRPIQAINNYENEIIDKVYWVDGDQQMRFINIYNNIDNGDYENLIDLDSSSINITGTYKTSQPEIISIGQGGIHTSGMIQYAYNLYKINGSQTILSPLSELISLDRGNNSGGGDVNEIVGSVPVVKVKGIDNKYTNIKLYAIKYTSYNQIPQISLILDKKIKGLSEVTYYDDGRIIQDISIEQFSFLGSQIIIPKHINTKNNIMFLSNYRERNFDVNTSNESNSVDLRAYSFSSLTSTTPVYNSLKEESGSITSDESQLNITSSTINTGLPIIDYEHSTINKNYDFYNKQFNSNVIGGEGPYLKYEIKRNLIGTDSFNEEDSKGKFLKDNEIYRLAIQFYNNYGQESLPKWIADFKTIVSGNQSNLNGYYASIKIILKPLFYTWLNDDNNFLDENGNFDESLKPVGYKLLRAERNISDRTILCQGLINGMLSQVNGDDTGSDTIDNALIIRANRGIKIPSMIRRFDEELAPMWGNKKYFRLDRFTGYHPKWNSPGTNGDSKNEVFRSAPSVGLIQGSYQWTQGTYQFTQLMQMFSPEITFNILQNINTSRLNVIGGLKNSYNSIWNQVRNVETKVVEHEAKTYNAISPHDEKALVPGNFELITGEKDNLQFHGFFAHNNPGRMDFVQVNREYKEEFYKSTSSSLEFITYGTPELSETGQGRKLYNNNVDLAYSNSLQPLAADAVLTNVNSWGAKNITFALGDNSKLTKDRTSIEQVYSLTGITDKGVGLLGEFRIEKNLVYLGNIYGGNSYESKKRSNYIEVGEYNLISVNNYNCLHAGDTFINDFKFTKLAKTETEVYNRNSEQVTEIVTFRVETTVDLKNRNDLSLNPWDNRFQPTYNEYQKYNRVYSQESNLLLRKDIDYRFKKVNGFDTNIIATKVKVPGELIDSWTDLQPNNTITLDGKNGPINSLTSWKDELYAYQDKAIAALSIQPRVQVQGSDGISVELGTGTVLADYKYITTNSGSINKWGIISTELGMFYLDGLNKSFNQISQEGINGLSDTEGFHKYFLDNINLDILKIDNPILYKGVSLGWDKVTNDVYLSLFKNEDKQTISYNLAQQGFSSFYDYESSMYIHSKGETYTINPYDNSEIFCNFIGKYNVFYRRNKPSKISFVLNPEPMVECTFNNLEYKSVALDSNNLEQRYTWERINSSNEFQNSGLINLVQNKNIRQLNRKWRLNIPRDNNKVNRIRNTWALITLESNNLESYNYTNNDIVSYYNPNYKIIQ